jgi:hypothetical protein
MALLYLKSPAAARELGITYSTLSNLIRHGHIAPPPKDSSGDFVWLPEDLERVRAVLAARRPRQLEGAARA